MRQTAIETGNTQMEMLIAIAGLAIVAITQIIYFTTAQ
jgi:hypothetical protein